MRQSLLGWLLLLLTGVTAVGNMTPPDTDTLIYLPLVFRPVGAELPSLGNPSFEAGWIDLPPAPGYLINQQPLEWYLTWIEPGQPLYSTTDLAGGVPECVHKFNYQLPPDEQRGGPHALVLDGEATYKIFHANAAFGAELRQTIYGLPAGSTWTLTVPMQVHLHGDSDPYSVEAGVWVNGLGQWVNGGEMGDRMWYEHQVTLDVPANGQVQVLIRVKSKWPLPKDFFLDDLRWVSTVSSDVQLLRRS